MNKKTNNFDFYTNIIGTDHFGIKSDYAPVSNSFGFPLLSDKRCCAENDFGTQKQLLKTEPMSISGYGLPIYSDLNKCGIKEIKNEKKSINKGTNENVTDKQVYSKRKANLGENVISYRIVNRKEKK